MDRLKDNILWRIWQEEHSGLLRKGSLRVYQSLWWMSLGMVLGLTNPNQVASFLGIPKDRLYRSLKELSPKDWIRLIQDMFIKLAAEHLLKLQSQSISSWSRAGVVLACDDTVLRRFAKALSYLGTWWSGQLGRTTKGHNVLVVVLKVQEKVYPVALWLMSKKGPKSSKPERLKALLSQVYHRFSDMGVDCCRISVTVDSWYMSRSLAESIRQIGFKDLTGPMKSTWSLETPYGKTSAGVLAKSKLEELWGTDRPGIRIRAFSPKLGEGTFVCAEFGRRRILWSSRTTRACEVINRYRAHHWVEVFFKRCKHTLGMGSMSLRGRAGAWTSVCVPLLGYHLVMLAQKHLGTCFDQVCAEVRKLIWQDYLHKTLLFSSGFS